MEIRVLGAGAGGGYPQWNCNHPNSRRARQGDPAARPRTQSSLAVSADGQRWFLFNASPDLRQQINANPVLQPAPEGPLRASPIQGVVLTNADVDHIAGLLNLRESQPLGIWGSRRVLEVLAANPVFNVLNPRFVTRRPLELDQPLELVNTDGGASGIRIIPFAVPGKVALWLEDPSQGPGFGTVAGDTIALDVSGPGGRFFYIPACAALTPELAGRLAGADLIFFDGTLWRDDEMIVSKVGVKTGRRMGHMSVSGDDGALAAFRDLGVKRKVFIHINTTNPILLEDSPERAAVRAAGWEVAFDGMGVEL